MSARQDNPDSLRELQYRFAGHIRDPEGTPAPGDVEDRRMAIYRGLFFNNIKNLLGSNFPVLRDILGEDRWRERVRDFMVRYRASTPMFPEIAREFLQYWQEYRSDNPQDPPFALELAHYEWVELALFIDPADPEALDFDPEGDLWQQAPVLSPVAWVLGYNWPVHRLSPDYQPNQPPAQPTWLLVYRKPQDQSVGFIELQPATARLCQLMNENVGVAGHELVERLAAELGQGAATNIADAAHAEMSKLRERGIILGTRDAAT